MAIITLPLLHPTHPHLRAFDPQRDLTRVADLVELCFEDTLDTDGRRYLRYLRSMGQYPKAVRRAASLADTHLRSMLGFVWEQDGELVGNLTLVVLPETGKQYFLIANVAVHPNFRGRGIAKMLTQAALDEVRSRKAHRVWLHVRQDNPAAFHLYQKMGFVERTRRTSWRWDPTGTAPQPSSPLTVVPRPGSHWASQHSWLQSVHPEELRWYYTLDFGTLQPGLWGFLHRMFSPYPVENWSVLETGRLLGVAARQVTHGAADRLWLALDPNQNASNLQKVLQGALSVIPSNRPLSAEFPARLGAETFQTLGFVEAQTLVWMQYPTA